MLLHAADVAAAVGAAVAVVSGGLGWHAAFAASTTWPAIHQVCYRHRTWLQWLGGAVAATAAAAATAASSGAAARWRPVFGTV